MCRAPTKTLRYPEYVGVPKMAPSPWGGESPHHHQERYAGTQRAPTQGLTLRAADAVGPTADQAPVVGVEGDKQVIIWNIIFLLVAWKNTHGAMVQRGQTGQYNQIVTLNLFTFNSVQPISVQILRARDVFQYKVTISKVNFSR